MQDDTNRMAQTQTQTQTTYGLNWPRSGCVNRAARFPLEQSKTFQNVGNSVTDIVNNGTLPPFRTNTNILRKIMSSNNFSGLNRAMEQTRSALKVPYFEVATNHNILNTFLCPKHCKYDVHCPAYCWKLAQY